MKLFCNGKRQKFKKSKKKDQNEKKIYSAFKIQLEKNV